MRRFKLWTLTHDNTSPFVIVAVVYFLLLSSPFMYFMYLHGQQEHVSPYALNAGNDSTTEDVNAIVLDTMPQVLTQEQEIAQEQAVIRELRAKEEQTVKKQTETVAAGKQNWRKDKESGPFILLTRLAIFSAVLAFGALGAAVSLVTRARNKGQIGNITAIELISIQTIGAIFASLLTLIFIANFIGGRLFPDPDLFYHIIYVRPAFAKLLIWSFIAGFSERFVPNLLNNIVKETEQKGFQEEVVEENKETV